MKQKTDFIFFGLTGLMIVSTITLSQFYGYVLNINNYLAFAAWPLAFFYRLMDFKGKRYPLGIVLMLGLFGILNFSIGLSAINFGSLAIPIDFLILLIITAYYLINKKVINSRLSTFFKGTEDDQNEEFQKTVDFYFKKFSSCDEEELKGILENYKDYPTAAQTALRQLQGGNGNATQQGLAYRRRSRSSTQ